MDKVIAFLAKIVGSDYLLITLASAFPLIEIKGSILLGISKGLPPIWVLLLSYLGSTIVAPIVLLFLKPLLNIVKKIPAINKAAVLLESSLQKKAKRFSEKNACENKDKTLFISLFLFVALPVPMTGVWSGAVIASFLNIDYVKALIAIVLGNTIAGLIVLSIALLFRPYADTIFALFLIAVAVALLFSIIYPIVDKKINRKKAIVCSSAKKH